MNCVEKNNIRNIRTKEIDGLINDLEIVINKLNSELLSEESKLALEDSRLREKITKK